MYILVDHLIPDMLDLPICMFLLPSLPLLLLLPPHPLDAEPLPFDIVELLGKDVYSLKQREIDRLYAFVAADDPSSPLYQDRVRHILYTQQRLSELQQQQQQILSLHKQIESLHRRNMSSIQQEASKAGYFSSSQHYLVKRNPRFAQVESVIKQQRADGGYPYYSSPYANQQQATEEEQQQEENKSVDDANGETSATASSDPA